MKLRIKGNSLRLRLTQREVARIGMGECVSESIEFGGGARLTYALECSEDADYITAHFDLNRISITLPLTQANEWVNTELVGLRAEQTLATESVLDSESNSKLMLLIEKDFVCIDGDPIEDQTDAFPHPNQRC